MRKCVSYLAGAAAAFLLAACNSSPPAAPAAPSAAASRAARTTWLFTSDWHFNPFDDPKLVDKLVRAPASRWRSILATSPNPPSPYFKDTNFALLESALAEMRAVLPNPPAVLIGGDFLAHKFRETFFALEPGAPESEFESFVDKDFAFLASEADRTYPNAQFLITIGNNDGYCGNYKSTPRSPFFARLADAWEPLVNRDGAAPNFVREFSNAGYYTATLPAKAALPAVVLNSVLWSALYDNACGDRRSDPGAAELAWLSSHLNAAHPLLLTHIPFGVDEYASWNANKPVPLYKVDYTRRLLKILAAKGIGPTAFVIGHIHHATFEIAPTGIGKLGAIVMPSISPSQGNNPAFVVATIDPRGPFIADTTTYIFQLGDASPAWMRLYSFDEAYGLTAFDAPNLLRLQARMAQNPRVRRQFFHYYNSASATATPPPDKWQWYWCGHVHLTPPPYAACLVSHP
jgi:sphingomyelin phosphodiesterase acid-like 3